jgi:hypothetical protein
MEDGRLGEDGIEIGAALTMSAEVLAFGVLISENLVHPEGRRLGLVPVVLVENRPGLVCTHVRLHVTKDGKCSIKLLRTNHHVGNQDCAPISTRARISLIVTGATFGFGPSKTVHFTPPWDNVDRCRFLTLIHASSLGEFRAP